MLQSFRFCLCCVAQFPSRFIPSLLTLQVTLNILKSYNWFLNNNTNGKRCYSFEKGNQFFFMKGIEYELLGAESIEGDKTWTGVIHRFKKRFPGPDDDKDDRWEVSMLALTNKFLAEQQNK